MAKSYIHELGDRLSKNSTAENLPGHIKEIAPVMYNDGNNNYASIQSALNGKASATHTHGNITNGGALQTNDVAIANGDKLVVTDASNSNKVARTSVSFDGSTTTKALTQKGTFEAFAKSGDITTAIQALDVSSVGGAGKYISAISETDGKISATATTMDTTPTASSTNAVTSGGVKTALDGKASSTHAHGWVASDGKLTNTPFAIENGDRLVIADNSDGSKVSRTTIQFDASTTSQVLTKKGTFENVSDIISGNYRSIPQDVSKGSNLIVNGSGTLCTNYNWPGYTFDGSVCYHASAGSFTHNFATGTWTHPNGTTTEYVQLDQTKVNEYSVDVKAEVTTGRMDVRFTIFFYDIDKKRIQADHILYFDNTTTTLSQDLNPGDTVVHLTSAANWNANISQTYQRGFIFWDYTNSYGYTYPPQTYSRNVYANWYDSASDVDTTNNTITLNKAWTGPKKLAGTSLSKCNSGNTYVYLSSYTASPTSENDWKTLTGTITASKFRAGTAFVKFGWVNNGADSTSVSRIHFTNVRVSERQRADAATKLATARKLAVNLANTGTDTTFDGSADQTGIKVSGTLPIANGGTGATTKKAAEYAINGGMSEATAAMADNFQIVFSRVGTDQNATNGVFIYRQASTVWNYIKSKLSSDTGVNISGNAATATTATKLGSSTLGSSTKPIYLSSGTATECSTYAGGTAVTLNGTSKSATTASFYAPTGAGTSGQLLKSSGSGAPTWATANAALVGITVTSSSVSDGTNTFNKYTHPTTSGNKHVPSGGSSGQFLGWDSDGTAKWVANPNTDTKNTAGSTDTSSKIFLIGATSQAANPQTYSQDTTYVDTDATLASTKVRVAEKCTLQFNTTTNALDFVFA